MRRAQAGLTLIEVMIASAVMVMMMTLAWRTIRNTSDTRRSSATYQERNHEIRMAMGPVVADFEGAYLSKNEDENATHRRTLFTARKSGKVPEVRFSTLGHRVLWADANESEQTVISYLTRTDPERPGVIDWVRREQRRMSNELPDSEPADYDVLVHDIAGAKIEFWNWKNSEWQDTWNTMQADAQKGWLPSRVRITITIKGPDDKDIKISSQARVWMQETVTTLITQ